MVDIFFTLLRTYPGVPILSQILAASTICAYIHSPVASSASSLSPTTWQEVTLSRLYLPSMISNRASFLSAQQILAHQRLREHFESMGQMIELAGENL